MSTPMKLAVLALTAFLVASPHGAEPSAQSLSEAPVEAGFIASTRAFADASACARHLVELVRASKPPAYDNAVGPYAIAPGDIRAHRVKAQDWGHDIEEHRCLGAALSLRSWTHSMSDVKPITVDDIGKMSFPD